MMLPVQVKACVSSNIIDLIYIFFFKQDYVLSIIPWINADGEFVRVRGRFFIFK